MPHGHPTQLVALDTPGAAVHLPAAALGPPAAAAAFTHHHPQFAFRGSAEMPAPVCVPSLDAFQIPPPPGLGAPRAGSGLTRELQIPSGYKLVMVLRARTRAPRARAVVEHALPTARTPDDVRLARARTRALPCTQGANI